jgi:acetate kinase
LGGGCSAAAVRSGMAVATTLGFSPLEGLMMGTRSGSVDPGILLYLQREHGLTVEELDHALNYSSGLLGISGVSSDLAQVEIAAARGNQRARLAFDMFADRVRSAIGALAATLGGVDALIFTDRVGEHSAALRAAACEGLEFMGLRLDPARNAAAQPDADVAKPDSPARIFVIHTQEELMVAREARRVAAAFVPDDGKTVT